MGGYRDWQRQRKEQTTETRRNTAQETDETRPRNQGASLTAYELGAHGVPHTGIVDNLGGHLMQHGRVDMVIVGSDRTTAAGDVCNNLPTVGCLGGATLDNEENYLIKKLFTGGLGMVCVSNQARI